MELENNVQCVIDWLKAGLSVDAVASLSGLSAKEIVVLVNDILVPERKHTARDADLVRRYEAGELIRELAASYGMHPGTVSNICRENHADRAKHLYNRKLPGSQFPFRDKTICESYLSGKTLQQVGKEFGMTRERVRQILVREGVIERHAGFMKPERVESRNQRQERLARAESRRNEMKAAQAMARMMYNENYSYEEIAAKLNFSVTWVQRAIWVTGGPSRSNAAGKPKRRIDAQKRAEIARQYAANIPVAQIAKQFDVCPITVQRIANAEGGYRPGHEPKVPDKVFAPTAQRD